MAAGIGENIRALARAVAVLTMVVGATVLMVGVVTATMNPDRAPRCVGRTMSPGEVCDVARGTDYTYESVLTHQRLRHERAIPVMTVGAAIFDCGELVFAATLVRRRAPKTTAAGSSLGTVPLDLLPPAPSRPAGDPVPAWPDHPPIEPPVTTGATGTPPH